LLALSLQQILQNTMKKLKEMKAKFIVVFIFLLALVMTVFAENKTEKIKVKGNCGMCEKRIEKAALDTDGVSKADWNKETKELTLVYDDAKTSAEKIHIAIAAVGHDTGKVKAKDEVYNKLPACCKYDRTGAQTEAHGHEGHGH
jgi:periplasmic mercuric ion binding protein